MNAKQIVLGIVLVGFAAMTLYTFSQHSVYDLFFVVPMMNAGTLLVTTDLVICLVLIGIWIWQDARARGVSPLPYIVLLGLFGSVGTLLYLIRRSANGTERVAASPVRA